MACYGETTLIKKACELAVKLLESSTYSHMYVLTSVRVNSIEVKVIKP